MKNLAKESIVLIVSVLFCLSSCTTVLNYEGVDQFAPPDIIAKIDSHVVAIATYYTMSEDEYQRRLQKKGGDSNWKVGGFGLTYLEEFITIETSQVIDGRPARCVAYIGAGTLVTSDKGGSYVLTVNHLFEHSVNTYSTRIWTFFTDLDHAVEADVIARTGDSDMSNDYALIKLRETLDRPGIRIATQEIAKGERVIYAGSVGGAAFFSRYCHITTFQYFFQTATDGTLNLSSWEDFPFWCVFTGGGAGDSGGLICNTRGELVSIMYCGLELHSQNYIFGNSLSMIYDFLDKYDLTWIGK